MLHLAMLCLAFCRNNESSIFSASSKAQRCRPSGSKGKRSLSSNGLLPLSSRLTIFSHFQSGGCVRTRRSRTTVLSQRASSLPRPAAAPVSKLAFEHHRQMAPASHREASPPTNKGGCERVKTRQHHGSGRSQEKSSRQSRQSFR